MGDGEEVEVEAGQELSTNDIGLIYKRYIIALQHLSQIIHPLSYRAQVHDNAMSEMEPVDTFTLTLRKYQKQALL